MNHIIIDTEKSQATTIRLPQTNGVLQPTAMVAIGVGALLLILIISLIVILSLIVWHRKRGTGKTEIEPNSGCMREDASYSTLGNERATRKQLQPQASNSTELYSQIHLSTGEMELISKTESKNGEQEVKVQGQPPLEDMYAVVYKKPKKSGEQEETPPPIPASTVESLYTAVKKIPQET
jgi:hypothetical protein